MDVIKNSDWLIDLGPEGGDEGGKIVATGTPQQVSKAPGSYTGKYLKKLLEKMTFDISKNHHSYKSWNLFDERF